MASPRPLRLSIKDAEPPQVTAEAAYVYDVFISFRGPDNRDDFTDSLYHRLKDAGVNTFRDDEELHVGHEIGPELMRAINQSRISMPIFSKGYASSKWCLKEVAEMVKRINETNHVIMPIFLDVTPNEVQHQTGSYANAFVRHEENFDSETVREWRDALKKVVKLKGLELKKEANGKYGEFIKKVLARVLRILKKAYLDVNKILVGINQHVEAVKTLLNFGSTSAQIVGIWGMGGIGKTTLAKVVYNQMLDNFESSCFLNDIRQTSLQHRGLEYLQSRLVSDILKCDREDFVNKDEGVEQLATRVGSKRVIILLDDINQVDQLKALARDPAWFGQGSRIIVTTREKRVLELCQISNVYELTPLSEDQAFELFCKHAFIKGFPEPDFEDMSWEIVRTTGRLPLALEVIGSSLSINRGKRNLWECTLKKLKRKPDMKVQDTLRISYDGLDHLEKEIFLDIACFFIGVDARIVIPMWDECGFSPELGIDILLLKSMITVTDENKLWMHDQLRDMGREIVEQENYKDPRLRSRLWQSEEAMVVLQRQPDEGKTKVEAISLEGCQSGLEDHCFMDKMFQNLWKLRIFQLDKASLAGNFKGRFPDLRWLNWQFCTVNHTPPANLELKNLVVLDLSRSTVSESWPGWSSMKEASRLKVLKLTSCIELRGTPDFSAFPGLERLILTSCSNLASLDPSIEQLSNLVCLDVRYCTSLNHLPQLGSMDALTELLVDGTRIREIPIFGDMFKLESIKSLSSNNCRSLSQALDSLQCLGNLKQLSLNGCWSLSIVPDFIGCLTSLMELSLSSTRVKILPEAISNLTLLNVLKINDSGLTCLPSGLSNLENLQVLNASKCRDLEGEVPINTGNKSSLRILQLDSTKISHLPSNISHLPSLETLHLVGCEKLQILPTLPSSLISLKLGGNSIQTIPHLENLTHLKELMIEGCSKVVEVPEAIRNLAKLEKLGFSKISITSIPEEVGILPNLREICIRKCKMLKAIPKLPSGLSTLEIHSCDSLTRMPNLSNLNMLSSLLMSCCYWINEIPGLQGLVLLKSLNVSGCSITHLDGLEVLESLRALVVEFSPIRRLPNLLAFKRLSEFKAFGCTELVEFDGLNSLYNLRDLYIAKCSSIEKLPDLSNLKLLTSFHLQDSNKLIQVERLPDSLQKFVIFGCRELGKLPDLSNLRKLNHLTMDGCEKIAEIPGLGSLESLEHIYISNCFAIERLPDLSKLKRLRNFVIKKMNIREIPGLGELESLVSLHIPWCESIGKLPNLSKLQKLEKLDMRGCNSLMEIPGLEELRQLMFMNISQSRSIEKLPNLPNLQKLKRLEVHGCYNLKEIPKLEELGNLEFLTVAQCKSIKKRSYESLIARGVQVYP